MPVPTWTPGEVLAAADVNSWFVPLNAYKSANTSRTSTTTLTVDPDLSLTVAANAIYVFDSTLGFEGGVLASSDIKWQFNLPSGSMNYSASLFGTGGGWAGNWAAGGTIVVSGSNGAGTGRPVSMGGMLFVGASGGTFSLSWAQNTSSGTATILYAKSYINLQRVA